MKRIASMFRAFGRFMEPSLVQILIVILVAVALWFALAMTKIFFPDAKVPVGTTAPR